MITDKEDDKTILKTIWLHDINDYYPFTPSDHIKCITNIYNEKLYMLDDINKLTDTITDDLIKIYWKIIKYIRKAFNIN